MTHVDVIDFPCRKAPCRPRYLLSDLQRRIEMSCQWLAGQKLTVLLFIGSTLSLPIVVVAAHPRVYALFSGRCERKGFRQDGALRYEVWEAIDRINQVRVRWEEVIACGA
jgi:hypothetical protein